MAKGKKIDFKKVAVNTLTAAGTGAIAQVVSEAVAATNQDLVDFGMIAAGVLLPELVKGNSMVETAGQSLVAIGGYKLAEKYDISGKLGITASAVKGFNDFHNIGATDGWNPGKTYQAAKVSPKGGKAEKSGANVL